MKRPNRVRYYKAAYRNDKLVVCCTRCERTLGTMLGNGRILGLNPCWPCRWLKVKFGVYIGESASGE